MRYSRVKGRAAFPCLVRTYYTAGIQRGYPLIPAFTCGKLTMSSRATRASQKSLYLNFRGNLVGRREG